MANFCSNCGAQINGGKFCSNCGASVTQVNAPVLNNQFGGAINSGVDSFNYDEVNLFFENEASNMEYSAFDFEKRADGTYIIKKLKDMYAFTVKVPSSTIVIDKGAFEGSNVMEVELPNSIRCIGNRAFANCSHLKRVNIPSSVCLIGDEAFLNCEKLDVAIPQNIDIGKNAFHGTLTDIKEKERIAEEKRQAEEKRKREAEEKKRQEEEKAKKEEEERKRIAEESRARLGNRLFGDYLYFGEFPQTVKSSSVTITEVKDSRGYYKGSDGCYYEMVQCIKPSYYDAKFSDGSEINHYATLYFKVEPIKWRKVSDWKGEMTFVSESILTCKAFDMTNENYSTSGIRSWLNDAFYFKAFSKDEKDMIVSTSVNSSSLDRYGYNLKDKVYLLSVEEASRYNEIKKKTVTDYCKGNGILLGGNIYGYWWLRTNSSHTYAVRGVLDSGSLSDYFAQSTSNYIGVVPAIQIKCV